MKLREIHLRVALTAISLGLLVWGFRLLLFDHAPYVFANPQEDMSFAWYVPLFSLYVIWTRRSEIAASVGAPSIWGVVFALPFLVMGFLGVRGIQIRFEMLALIGLLIAVPWAMFGRRTAASVAFPALYLLFCLPLSNFLDIVTVHLRLLASSVAYAVLSGAGADVVRSGTVISSQAGEFAIDVAEPCAGLRSLFAMMALTAAYAYFTQPTWLRRGVLFALSVPIAVIGNVVRIITICMVAAMTSQDFAAGFYHDYSGYVVFAAAILLMVSCGEAISRLCRARKEGK